ncbi:hypothetical protein [Alkaliphilus crotonatoxidans]
MASQTPNLNLYKVNPETDGEMTFNVKTMLNENWDRLDESIGEVHQEITTHRADYVRHPGYAVTAGTGNAYTITTDPAPTAYVDGMGIVIRANRANTGAATLNWNGLGAVPIVDAKGNPLIAGKIPNGARLSLRYSSAAENFQLQGEGGEYGTATPAEVMQGYTIGTEEGVLPGTLALTGNAAAGDVIAGQTFYNTNPKSKITGTLALTGDAAAAQVLSGRTFYNTNPKSRLTGTMANRGAVTNTITTQGGQYTIPQGYHSGSGVVTASFANLIPGNVRQGVNIGGIVGTLIDGSNMLRIIEGTTVTVRVNLQPSGWMESVARVGSLPFKPKLVFVFRSDDPTRYAVANEDIVPVRFGVNMTGENLHGAFINEVTNEQYLQGIYANGFELACNNAGPQGTTVRWIAIG